MILVLASSASSARADGSQTPIRAAQGHSLYGAPWSIRCGEEEHYGSEPDYLTCLFSVGTEAEREECDGCGYYSSIPLPLPKAFPFSGSFGGEFDNFPEGDFSGIAGPLVARVAVQMKDGSVAETEVLRAPARVVAHHPRLSRFRFFDVFFPETDEPVSISAYGRGGKLVKTERISRG